MEADMRYEHADQDHPILDDSPWERMAFPRSAKLLLLKCGGADTAILAYHGKELVGFVRISVADNIAAGTWVAPKFRRQGLALRMWKRILQEVGDDTIDITAVTRGGEKLVDSMIKRGWDVVS